ncbi:hypothetical protein CDD81_7165 [Ophiocordyceps australis]|uniref:Uncharacterized protein n=1 Tax=Ophiocordyceps australis TaxID=1399860 RepID=A0A2C5X939_9HYPO|nr:hypothetical protein CDD81_7165 [Ophiocordyceps australis]
MVVAMSQCADLWEPTQAVGRAADWYCFEDGASGVYSMCKGDNQGPQSCTVRTSRDWLEVGRGAAGRGVTDSYVPQIKETERGYRLGEGSDIQDGSDSMPDSIDTSLVTQVSGASPDSTPLPFSGESNDKAAEKSIEERTLPECKERLGWSIDIGSTEYRVPLAQGGLLTGPSWFRPSRLACAPLTWGMVSPCNGSGLTCSLYDAEVHGRTGPWIVPLAHCRDLAEPSILLAAHEGWYCFPTSNGRGMFALCGIVSDTASLCRGFSDIGRGPDSGLPNDGETSTRQDALRDPNAGAAAAVYLGAEGSNTDICGNGGWRLWHPTRGPGGYNMLATGDYVVRGSNRDYCGYSCYSLGRFVYVVEAASHQQGGCSIHSSRFDLFEKPRRIEVDNSIKERCAYFASKDLRATPGRVMCMRAAGNVQEVVMCLGLDGNVALGCEHI